MCIRDSGSTVPAVFYPDHRWRRLAVSDQKNGLNGEYPTETAGHTALWAHFCSSICSRHTVAEKVRTKTLRFNCLSEAGWIFTVWLWTDRKWACPDFKEEKRSSQDTQLSVLLSDSLYDSCLLYTSIQTYASMQHLPSVDYIVERENTDSFHSENNEPVAVIMSAWWMRCV